MEIYLMKSDGTGLKRLTNVPGYDGGPFFSPDGKKFVGDVFLKKATRLKYSRWTWNLVPKNNSLRLELFHGPLTFIQAVSI